jgi:PTS system fructose-specific IIC component
MPPEATIPPVLPLTLRDYTQRTLVLPELRERDIAGIINELSQALHKQGVVQDLLPFYHAAMNQELMANSALPCGLAFPHARLGGVKQLQFAFGRVATPVNWGAKGSWPVQCIFLLAVPATDAASYLHLLACLARMGQQAQFAADLRAAANAEGLLEVLGRIKLRRE